MRGSAVFQRVLAEPEGVFTATGSIDGVRRLYVHKRLADLPIIVDVAPAEADIYADWRRRATWLGVLMGVFSATIATGAWLLTRELRRRQLAETRLQRLARTDAMTGLRNRGAFDEALDDEASRARRTGRTLSLLFVDVDHFKAYNDYYGHQAGDEVLRAVARCLSLCMRRAADVAARYGGEEFVAVLPETDATGASTVAETVRAAIYALNLEHVKSPHGRITVSIGTVTARGGAECATESLVKRADAALYEAKSAGRNRVCEAQAAFAA